MNRPLLACAAVLAVSAPAGADTGGTFRDWALTCTPGLRCSAATYAPGSGVLAGFGLERGAAEDAPLLLQLGIGEDQSPTGEVVFSVDGASTLTVPASAFTKGVGGTVSTAQEGVRAILLPRLREGRTVEVAAEIGGKPVSGAFSLSGLVATLRKLDEDQGRIGTQTALTDRGDKPLPDRAKLPEDIATPDDLPPPVRAVWQVGGCAERDPDNPYGDLGFSVAAGSDTRLFVLACGMPGAYNFPSRLYAYVSGAQDADVVPLPGMSADGPTADMTAWNVDLSGDRLHSFFKGRGIGDCGQTATWRIDAETGDLVLVEARDKEVCDGADGDAGAWPVVWPRQ